MARPPGRSVPSGEAFRQAVRVVAEGIGGQPRLVDDKSVGQQEQVEAARPGVACRRRGPKDHPIVRPIARTSSASRTLSLAVKSSWTARLWIFIFDAPHPVPPGADAVAIGASVGRGDPFDPQGGTALRSMATLSRAAHGGPTPAAGTSPPPPRPRPPRCRPGPGPARPHPSWRTG